MRHRLFVGLLALVMLSACGGSAAPVFNQTSQGLETGGGTAAAAESAAGGTAGVAAPVSELQQQTNLSGEQNAGAPNAQAPVQRLVIRTANLQLLVEKVDDAEVQVRRLADTRGGYVLSSQASGEESERRATVELKVPAQRFDEVIAELSKIAIKVEGLDVKGQDVTDEYVDLESRLRNLRAVEARLQQFLNEAKRIEDLLQINQQLGEIQGQIEEAQGRITYLKQSAALSTITVSLYSDAVVSLVPEESWSPVTTGRAAAKNLIVFGQGLADLGIVLAVWAPFWLPFLIATLWIRRRLRRPGPTASVAQP